MRQDVRGNEALHARPIGQQDGAERFRVAVQHGLKGFFSRLRDHGLFLFCRSAQPPCGRREYGKDALYKKSVPLRAELLQRAGKFLGKEIGVWEKGPSPKPTPHPPKRFDWWGGCASGVPLGGKRSGRGDGAYEDGESLSRFLWGCRPWFSIRERSPFAYCFYRCLLGEPRSGKSIGFFSV